MLSGKRSPLWAPLREPGIEPDWAWRRAIPHLASSRIEPDVGLASRAYWAWHWASLSSVLSNEYTVTYQVTYQVAILMSTYTFLLHWSMYALWAVCSVFLSVCQLSSLHQACTEWEWPALWATYWIHEVYTTTQQDRAYPFYCIIFQWQDTNAPPQGIGMASLSV